MRNRNIGELGLSYMGGIYNKFEEDGIVLDQKRRVNVFAIDFSTTIPKTGTALNTEWAWVKVNIPKIYTEQFGRSQQGGFLDIVHPILKRSMLGFEQSVLNAAIRFEYVDWNRDHSKSTGSKIADHIYSIVPAISWRPSSQTVLRFNYRYNWQTDLLGNPPSKIASFLFG